MKAEEFSGVPLEGLFNVAQLLGQPIGSRHNYSIGEILVGKNKDLVRGDITVIRSGKGIIIRGEATVDVELTCSRCLDIFLQPISFRIEEEAIYLQNIPGNTPLFEEVDGFTIDSHNVLDLGELLRQYTLLNIPMKALCKPDCIGNKEVF